MATTSLKECEDGENHLKYELNPKFLKEIVLSGKLNRPVVIRRKTDQWPCRNWTLDDWAKKFNDKKLRFRIGPIDRSDSEPLWESDCDFVEATISEFIEWETNDDNKDGQKVDSSMLSLSSFDHSKYWAYADYKHMVELFNDDCNIEMFKCVDWSECGFDGRNGKESTIWIGSPSSETPCHYDTYGCNLVAQLVGRKRWILFPPNDAVNLYPTRIPYEESSVFSLVNIQNSDIEKYERFKLATPYIVTLEPGEVLFVPHKWWHYVTSLTTTVSINTWIELENDNEIRLEEAVTRTLVSAFVDTYPFQSVDWLNPTEEEIFPDGNLDYVQESLERCLEKNVSYLTNEDEFRMEKTKLSVQCSSPKAKKKKMEHLDFDEYGDTMKPIEPSNYLKLADFVKKKDKSNECSAKEEKNNQELFKTMLLNSIVDSEVISLICDKFKKKFNYKITKL